MHFKFKAYRKILGPLVYQYATVELYRRYTCDPIRGTVLRVASPQIVEGLRLLL